MASGECFATVQRREARPIGYDRLRSTTSGYLRGRGVEERKDLPRPANGSGEKCKWSVNGAYEVCLCHLVPVSTVSRGESSFFCRYAPLQFSGNHLSMSRVTSEKM